MLIVLFRRAFEDYWSRFTSSLFFNAIQFALLGGILALMYLPIPFRIVGLGLLSFFYLISHYFWLLPKGKGKQSTWIWLILGTSILHSLVVFGAFFSLWFYFSATPSFLWIGAFLGFWGLVIWSLAFTFFPALLALGLPRPLGTSLFWVLSDLPRCLLLGFISLILTISSVLLIPGGALASCIWHHYGRMVMIRRNKGWHRGWKDAMDVLMEERN